MKPFAFDPTLSAEKNINSFLDSLREIDPEMAELLSANIGKLLPLPDGQARSAARMLVHREVKKTLDRLAE